jgi:hypothetical protein
MAVNPYLQKYMNGGSSNQPMNSNLSAYAAPRQAAINQGIADTHTLKSFTMLDPGTRTNMLKSFTVAAAKGDKQALYKLNLLSPHLKDQQPLPPAPKQSLWGQASDIATATAKGIVSSGVRDVKTGADMVNQAVKGGYHLGAAGVDAATGNKAAANKQLLQEQADQKKSFINKTYGTKNKNDISGLGNAGGFALDMAGLKGGGTIAEGASKVAAKDLTKVGAKEVAGKVVKDSAKGAAYGASYGAVGAAQNNSKKVGDYIKGAEQGAIAGGVLGAAGGVLGSAAERGKANKIAALREQLSSSTLGGKLGQLKNLIDQYDAAHQKALPAGNTEKPLALPAKSSVPIQSNHTPGGGVMINGDSAAARVARSGDNPGVVPTQLASKTKYGIAASPGKNLNDLVAPGKKIIGTKFEPHNTTTQEPTGGKNMSDLFAPKTTSEQRASAGKSLVDEKPNTNISTASTPVAKTNLNSLMQQWSKDKMPGANSRGTIAKVNTLNSIIEHPDASPEIKLKATQERHQLVHNDAKNTLAQEHSAQTGQPVAASHETLAGGNGEHAPLYNAVEDSRKAGVPAAVAQDYKGAAAEKTATATTTPTVTPDRSSESENAGKRNIYSITKEHIAPESRSQLSRETGTHLRNALGTAENAKSVEAIQNKASMAHFSKLSTPDQIKDVSDFERTGHSDLAPKGYDKFYQKTTDDAHATAAKVLGEDKVGYVDNYVKHFFTFGDNEAEAKGAAVLHKLAGDKSITKGRLLDMPMDEALATMKKAGIDVKPAFTNREELRQITVANSKRLEAFDNAYKGMQKDGIISPKHNAGWVELPRTVTQALSPNATNDKLFVAPEVLTMLKNVTSQGMSGSRSYQLARDLTGTVTQIDLSLSAYHAGMTAITNGVSHLADVFPQLRHGDLAGAGSSLVKSIPGVGVTKDLIDGRTLRNGLRDGDPRAIEKLNVISQAGGRVALQHDFKSTMTSKMKEAYERAGSAENSVGVRAKGAVEGTARVPFAIVHQVSRPLMEYAIPRIKDGMMLDQAAQVSRRYGGLDSMEAKIALAKSQTSIDNRMGEIVFSNRFWNKSAQDLGKLAYLSAGYRIGTVGELGGGVKDALTGKLTGRSAFLAALPIYVGTLGAAYQYLHTGQAPQTLKDYFYPKNGQTDQNGNPVRIQLPSYMRDFKNIASGNIGKEVLPNSPFMSLMSDIYNNKDYFGNEVRNPNDSVGTQLAQTAKYAGGQLTPISIQNSNKLSGTGGKIESFFGVTKAPAVENESSIQKQILQLKGPQAPKTPEAAARSQLEDQFFTDMKAGKKPAQSAAYGQLKNQLSPSSLKALVKGSTESSIQYDYNHLTDPQKIQLVLKNKPSDMTQLNFNDIIKKVLTNNSTAKSMAAGHITPQQMNQALRKMGVTNKSATVSRAKAQAKAATRASYRAGRGKPKYKNPFLN